MPSLSILFLLNQITKIMWLIQAYMYTAPVLCVDEVTFLGVFELHIFQF